MRNVILTFIIFLFTGSVLAEGVLPEHSGAWYNAEQPGHGFSVEVISSERAVVYWYAFDPDGHPMWLYIDGTINGNIVHGKAYYLDGMVWGTFDPSTKNLHDWGTVEIEFSSCRKATVTWNSLFPGYGAGQLELERLTSICGQYCNDSMFSTTGYWEVDWSDLTSAASVKGAAIVDDRGLVTIQFPEAHLIGMLAPSQSSDQPMVLDARLDLGPWVDARELSLVGTPTENGFQFASETDSFEFNFRPDHPIVSVSQAYLDGAWTLRASWSGGQHWHVEMVDGEFTWQVLFIDALIDNTVQLMVPYYQGNVIPIVVTSVPWPNETFAGHAFYWKDAAVGMEYIEIRWVWDDVILVTYMMERPIP
jgi:hypothetical protein